ncbi:MAG: AraD1 family protein, partial [Terriglobales bacterium]
GLTHLKSAENRQAMHAAGATLTDSMRMYEWGVEGGRPSAGSFGVSPEWFYKGSGAILRGHGEPLLVPPHAQDGGEEAEIAGIYIVDREGSPRRIGMAAGNEFSDHVFEEKNYLYLAASKLMTCALGPELIVDADFCSVAGDVAIERGGNVVWRSSIRSGEEVMCHTLANMEHHHFKHPAHRRPGDLHVHFFGADAFSFGDRIQLQDGDVMQVQFSGFGRPLRNPVRVDRSPQTFFAVQPL